MPEQVLYSQTDTLGSSPTIDNPRPEPPLGETPEFKKGRSELLNTVSSGHLSANYTYAIIRTSYETDDGVRVGSKAAASGVPGQSSRSSNVVVRVRNPRTIKTVSWTVQRMYVKPVLPHWDTGNPNEILLSKTISIQNPSLGIYQRIWSASGVYTYAFAKEPFVTVNGVERLILVNGVPPTEDAKTALYSYDQGDFDFRQLDASWVPASGYFQSGKDPITQTSSAR